MNDYSDAWKGFDSEIKPLPQICISEGLWEGYIKLAKRCKTDPVELIETILKAGLLAAEKGFLDKGETPLNLDMDNL
jgi:hypothetical protein